MPGQKTRILMTGATGYVGGSILDRFLKRPDVSSYEITALVRSPERAKKLSRFGMTTVVGSHSDATLMESLAADNDIIFSTADSDNYEAAIATLKGMKKRHTATGTVPILIHTSGTGLLIDNAAGQHATDVIYDDKNADQIESYIKSYIVLPSTIYGIASGVLVDQGIQNPHSMQVPQLIRAALDRGQAGMVGEGKNIWPDVDIDDVADLYIVLFDSIRTNPSGTGHGREGHYFGESGEHTMYEVAKAIGDALVEIGKSKNPEPSTFTKEEIDKYLKGSTYLGTNSRCQANRSRAIGWKPLKNKTDFLASISPEVRALARS